MQQTPSGNNISRYEYVFLLEKVSTIADWPSWHIAWNTVKQPPDVWWPKVWPVSTQIIKQDSSWLIFVRLFEKQSVHLQSADQWKRSRQTFMPKPSFYRSRCSRKYYYYWKKAKWNKNISNIKDSCIFLHNVIQCFRIYFIWHDDRTTWAVLVK